MSTKSDEPKRDPLEGIDFSIWEKLYGRELNYFEKLEIKINCIDWATWLIKGDLQRREKELEEYKKTVRSAYGITLEKSDKSSK